MTVECASCGSIEVCEDDYQKIIALPEGHWQMKNLRDGIGKVSGLVVISKNEFDVLEAGPLKSKLTKMEKWSLRKKAERKNDIKANIFLAGKNDQNST